MMMPWTLKEVFMGWQWLRRNRADTSREEEEGSEKEKEIQSRGIEQEGTSKYLENRFRDRQGSEGTSMTVLGLYSKFCCSLRTICKFKRELGNAKEVPTC